MYSKAATLTPDDIFVSANIKLNDYPDLMNEYMWEKRPLG